MKKFSFILAATAALTLTMASCQKESTVTPSSVDDVWEVELNYPQTKSISEVNLVIGSEPSQELTATLLKNGYPYDGNASFTWHNQNGTYYSGVVINNKCTITAGKVGSGSSVYVDGYSSDRVKRATSNDIAINVTNPVGEEYYYCSIEISVKFNGESSSYPFAATLSNYPEGAYITIPHSKAAQGFTVTVNNIGGCVCNAKTGYEQIDFTWPGTLPTGLVARSTNTLTSAQTEKWQTTIITQYQGTGPTYTFAVVDENSSASGTNIGSLY